MASTVHSLAPILCFTFLLLANIAFSADSPEFSPSTSPHSPPGVISSPPEIPSPSPELPHSLLSPSPSNLAPYSPSPVPSRGADDGASSDQEKSPSPVPDVAADVVQDDQTSAGDLRKDGSGGMNGGQKAGFASGVIVAVCIAVLGALVHKKRKQNIRRSQYGYGARREVL